MYGCMIFDFIFIFIFILFVGLTLQYRTLCAFVRLFTCCLNSTYYCWLSMPLLLLLLLRPSLLMLSLFGFFSWEEIQRSPPTITTIGCAHLHVYHVVDTVAQREKKSKLSVRLQIVCRAVHYHHHQNQLKPISFHETFSTIHLIVPISNPKWNLFRLAVFLYYLVNKIPISALQNSMLTKQNRGKNNTKIIRTDTPINFMVINDGKKKKKKKKKIEHDKVSLFCLKMTSNIFSRQPKAAPIRNVLNELKNYKNLAVMLHASAFTLENKKKQRKKRGKKKKRRSSRKWRSLLIQFDDVYL